MSPGVSFEAMWSGQEFELPEEELDLCPYAAPFHAWAQALIADVSAHTSEVGVNVAKVYLVDRYAAFYVSVPRQHQNHVGQRGGHFCLFQVFMSSYNALRILELGIAPPSVRIPPPPAPVVQEAPPQPLQIAGIFLGDEE